MTIELRQNNHLYWSHLHCMESPPSQPEKMRSTADGKSPPIISNASPSSIIPISWLHHVHLAGQVTILPPPPSPLPLRLSNPIPIKACRIACWNMSVVTD